MDFEFSPEEEKFREELTEFIEDLLPDWWAHENDYNMSERAFEVTLKVCAEMAKRGWLTMNWPEEYGGRDAPLWEQLVMREVMWARHEPRGPQYMSTNWVGPSIMAFGTEEQKKKFLPEIAAGQSLWCQGFSEPQAGSDLASVRTTAVRDGDEYVINGEKIWTSHWPHAKYTFLVTRTNPNAPKHKGISVFLVPMDTPGISIRPIESLTGGAEFSQITFQDVRVPASTMLGDENDGWRTTIEALRFERIGAPRYIVAFHILQELIDYCKTHKRNGKLLVDHDWVRHRIAELRADMEVGKLLYYRAASLKASNEEPTLATSLQRIASTTVIQKVADFAYEIAGTEAQKNGELFTESLGGFWLGSISTTIAAGTLEVQKNQVATRGLKLPRS